MKDKDLYGIFTVGMLIAIMLLIKQKYPSFPHLGVGMSLCYLVGKYYHKSYDN